MRRQLEPILYPVEGLLYAAQNKNHILLTRCSFCRNGGIFRQNSHVQWHEAGRTCQAGGGVLRLRLL